MEEAILGCLCYEAFIPAPIVVRTINPPAVMMAGI